MTKLKTANIAAVAVVILLMLVSVSPGFAAGTPEQRKACRADAMKFCRDQVPNVKRITACMEKNISKLSPLCRTQFR